MPVIYTAAIALPSKCVMSETSRQKAKLILFKIFFLIEFELNENEVAYFKFYAKFITQINHMELWRMYDKSSHELSEAFS